MMRSGFGDIGMLLSWLAGMLPLLVVWLVGLVLAAMHWNRYPKACALTAVATVLAGATSIGTRVVYQFLPQFTATMNIAMFFSVVNIVASCVHAVAWGCLLAAVFAGRREVPAENPGYGKPWNPPQ